MLHAVVTWTQLFTIYIAIWYAILSTKSQEITYAMKFRQKQWIQHFVFYFYISSTYAMKKYQKSHYSFMIRPHLTSTFQYGATNYFE